MTDIFLRNVPALTWKVMDPYTLHCEVKVVLRKMEDSQVHCDCERNAVPEACCPTAVETSDSEKQTRVPADHKVK